MAAHLHILGICGTFMGGLAALMAIPIGIGAAVFLTEFPGNRLARPVRFFSDVMTGVPSVFEIWFTREAPYDHRSSKASDFYKNIRFSDLLLQQGVLKAAEKFFISAVHSDEDIERTVAAFHVALEQLAKEVQ